MSKAKFIAALKVLVAAFAAGVVASIGTVTIGDINASTVKTIGVIALSGGIAGVCGVIYRWIDPSYEAFGLGS